MTRVEKFENDVNSYGTQTNVEFINSDFSFENDVNSFGTQTLGEIPV